MECHRQEVDGINRQPGRPQHPDGRMNSTPARMPRNVIPLRMRMIGTKTFLRLRSAAQGHSSAAFGFTEISDSAVELYNAYRHTACINGRFKVREKPNYTRPQSRSGTQRNACMSPSVSEILLSPAPRVMHSTSQR